MGNTIKYHPFEYIDNNIWKPITTRLMYTLIQNTFTNQQLERYTIFIRSNFEINQQIYESRKKNQRCGVRCIAYFREINNNFCQSNYNYCIITERINRLNSVSKIDISKALLYLKECLVQYEELSKYYGKFKITDRMIGTNKQGRIKVWINENFGMNTVGQQLDGNVDEQKLVLNIHKIIAEKTSDDEFTNIFHFQSFSQKINFRNVVIYLQNYKTSSKIKLVKFTPESQKITVDHNDILSYPRYINSSNNLLTTSNQNVFHGQLPTSSIATISHPSCVKTKTYTTSTFSKIDFSRQKQQILKQNRTFENIPKESSYRKINLNLNKSLREIADNLYQTTKKEKLQNIAKVDSILMIEKEQDYLGKQHNIQDSNIIMIQSTILRS